MLKVLIWRVSNETSLKDKTIKILEEQHNGIEIVGEAVNETISKVNGGGYDVLLCVGARKIGMSRVTKNAVRLNLPEGKLLGDWIACIPGFTLEKYRNLQGSCLSIFAMNCFGGLIYNKFGLPFRSPFINMFFKEQGYIRFLQTAQDYMEEELTLKATGFDPNLKKNYPIINLGDVNLHMNHYPDFDTALKKWNERKKKINWHNLFVTMYTRDEKILQEFDALPYAKKACFVPFKSDLASAWYINPDMEQGKPFWLIVNHFATGNPFYYYDPFDMLLYGKKTPLINT